MTSTIDDNEFSEQLAEHMIWMTKRATGYYDGNTDAADDLVQKTLIKAYNNREKCKKNLAGWMNTMMYRIFLDANRKKKVLKMVELKDHHYTELPRTPDEAFEEASRVEEIEGAIAGLPDIHREVIELWIKTESAKDIADTLNIPIGTVKSRVSRAREKLAEILEVAM